MDEIIARQNREVPTATFESFIVENGARKVLKELLGDFQVSQEEVKQKLLAQQDFTKATR